MLPKHFDHNLLMFKISQGLCTCQAKPFESSVMYAGKVSAYPSEAPFRSSTQGIKLIIVDERKAPWHSG